MLPRFTLFQLSLLSAYLCSCTPTFNMVCYHDSLYFSHRCYLLIYVHALQHLKWTCKSYNADDWYDKLKLVKNLWSLPSYWWQEREVKFFTETEENNQMRGPRTGVPYFLWSRGSFIFHFWELHARIQSLHHAVNL